MILGQSFLNDFANREVNWGFGDLSKFIVDTKYSRLTSQVDDRFKFSNNEKEEWWEIVARNIESVFDQLEKYIPRARITKRDKHKIAHQMYRDMFNFVWTPAGRPIRNLGSILLNERGGACLNNCSFINFMDTDPETAMRFIIDMSMQGTGVGIKIGDTNQRIYKPKKRWGEVFIIPDTTKGWVDAVGLLARSYLNPDKNKIRFDYSEIRKKGTPIRTGGIHEGFEPLKEMLDDLRWVFENHEMLCTRALADISNIIGKAVVNGGQRRTALILVADEDNDIFKDLKNPDKYPYRFEKKIAYTSNNSYLVESDNFDFTKVSDSIVKNGNGEPAVIFMKNKKYGRLEDGENLLDMLVQGANPCAEILLENYETCNLMELNINKLPKGSNTLYQTLYNVLLFAKIVSHIPTKWHQTNQVVKKNRRIGISLTGIIEYLSNNGDRKKFNEYLDRIYLCLKKADRKISQLLRCNQSIKLTTIKPSGTISLLMGTTAGIHAWFGEYIIRHVEVPRSSGYGKIYKEKGYRVSPSIYKDNVDVIAFPIHIKGIKTQAEQTIQEQFELLADVQRWYSDNAISITVNFKDEEISLIPTALEMYQDSIKSVSFLKYDGHVYEQAPFVLITKDEYTKYIEEIWFNKSDDTEQPVLM